jgi:sugar O-acyltransferase (sialic acid O-acetyltransferase NeuD family)
LLRLIMKFPLPRNSKSLIGLFGAGGFGREIMPTLMATHKFNLRNILNPVEYCFVELDPIHRVINEVHVISQEEFFQKKNSNSFFNIAISDYHTRKKLSEKAINAGVRPINIISSKAIVHATAKLGEGAIIADFANITANVEIGIFFHANFYSYVAHDCKIGNFVTFAPGVKCNGNVIIEDNVYIGANAIIKPGSAGKPRVIGSGSIIGMGAVVLHDVAPNTTVVGNPARQI